MALYNEPYEEPYGGYQGAASDIGGAASGAGDTLGSAAMIPGPQQPFLAGASLGLKGVGTVESIYGKYQERQDANKRYQEQLKAWELREEERKADKALEAQRRDRQEGYFSSEFNQNLVDDLAGSYGGYRTPGV